MALEIRRSRIHKCLFALVFPAFCSLLAGMPLLAEDLVFPQGQFLNLSNSEKRSYARLDFTAGLALRSSWLSLWPERIVPAGAPAWAVPPVPVKLRWNSLFPSIFVPAGDYNLVFTGAQLAPRGLRSFGCANDTIQMSATTGCSANCNSTAMLDPVEVAIPWKAIAGERYEIQAEQVVRAPLPVVQWVLFDACRYRLASATGYGVADITLTNTSALHGTAAIPVIRSVRFSLTGSGLDTEAGAISAPAAQGLQPSAAAEPAWLTVTSTPSGASIRVNQNIFGKTPAKLKLVAGDYAIAIELPGFTIWKRTLKLVSGSAISVDAQLAPASSPPSESLPPPPPRAQAAPPS